MAATTPTEIYPAGSETGLRLDERLIVLKDPYAGDSTQVEWQVQVASNSGFTTIVHDTELRANDDHINGDDWWELWPSLMNSGDGLQSGTQYWWRCRVRNGEGTPVTSSYSTGASFTMETAALTASEWAEAV